MAEYRNILEMKASGCYLLGRKISLFPERRRVTFSTKDSEFVLLKKSKDKMVCQSCSFIKPEFDRSESYGCRCKGGNKDGTRIK